MTENLSIFQNLVKVVPKGFDSQCLHTSTLYGNKLSAVVFQVLHETEADMI